MGIINIQSSCFASADGNLFNSCMYILDICCIQMLTLERIFAKIQVLEIFYGLFYQTRCEFY